MATITVKNIPPGLYERLKILAKLRHRSINSEIIYNLERSLGITQEEPRQLREQLKEFRERVGKKGQLSAEEIRQATNEGRS